MAFQDVNKQRQVKSDLKVKRTVYREPENPVRFAYEKLLREQARTRQVFMEIDPYVEVYTFRENIKCIYTLSLDGMGDSWIFLIEGPQRALLIDTSFGLGDLKGLVEHLLNGKPFDVVNTHAHFDHCYGNYQFDKVYCHEYEVPLLKTKLTPHVWDFLFDENGKGIWAEFPREDLVPYREYEIIGVPDGYVFDLGEGYEVELIHLPGHSAGHAAFLDRKSRILFPGDDCCVGAAGVGDGPKPGLPYGEYYTVEALTEKLRTLVQRMDEFDSMFPSHGPLETGPIMLVSLLETCEEVLADPSCYDFQTERERDGIKKTLYGRRIFESGYVQYSKYGVYKGRIADIT